MQALRPALRRRLPLRRPLLAIRRPQTGGPHKEYFQSPGLAPVPDTTPYNPAEPVRSLPVAGPSVAVRAARSVLWSILFGIAGIGAGTGLITWEYLQPPFEPGSPEETELYEDIVDALETHPVVEDLRNDNWIEENFYSARPLHAQQGLNLIHEKLTGIRGLTIKCFRHPSLKYTLLLFFTGFGVEGWPDVLHGGVTASLIIEGLERHLKNHYVGHVEHGSVDYFHLDVNYQKPLRPGEIYAIVVPPAGIEREVDDPTNNKHIMNLVTLVMQLEAAPRLGSQFDAATNTETHTMEIPSSHGHDPTCAIGKIQIPFEEIPDEGPEAEGEPSTDVAHNPFSVGK